MTIIDLAEGRTFDFSDPENHEYDLEDIAHALSLTCRFGGHVPIHYSVAEHCLRMAHLVDPLLKVHVLLHDAAEAYIGDVVGPFKDMIPEIDAMERRILKAIYAHFEVRVPTPPEAVEIKKLDYAMYLYERSELLPGAVSVIKPEEWHLDSLSFKTPLGSRSLGAIEQIFLDEVTRAIDVHRAWKSIHREEEEW